MKTEKRVIKIHQHELVYTVQYKQVKHITLKIEEGGELLVVSNPFIPLSKIEACIVSKIQWIIKKQAAIKQKENRFFHSILEDDVFYLMDNKLKIVLIKDIHNQVDYDENHLYVHYIDELQADKMINMFIREQCEKHFSLIVYEYMQKLSEYHIAYPKIKFRTMKSRWGSCIPAKMQITFNTRLLHCPKAFIEYVVLHELVHFIKPDHSKEFYTLISYYMPDYKKRIALL